MYTSYEIRFGNLNDGNPQLELEAESLKLLIRNTRREHMSIMILFTFIYGITVERRKRMLRQLNTTAQQSIEIK